MSQRRAHHKSKFGCSTCKKRRVKCDLARPDCINCKRRGIECGFRTLNPAPHSVTLAKGHTSSYGTKSTEQYTLQTSASTLPKAYGGLLDSFPDVMRPRFAQLLHHFAIQTSATLSHDAAAQNSICAAVPELSDSHKFVMNGIFAVTALHLSRNVTARHESKHLQSIAAAQMNTGLVGYKRGVEDVTAENAEALFTYSLIATAFTFLTTADECRVTLEAIGSSTQDQDRRRGAINRLSIAVTTCLRCIRGVRVIIVPCWHLLVRGILSPIVRRDWWPHPIPTSQQALEDDRKLQNIENLWMRPNRPYEYWFESLIQALKKLREDFALVSQLIALTGLSQADKNHRAFDWGSTMSWPVSIPPDFVILLENKRPEAWVIFAHYAILPSKAGDVWWLKDFAPNIVSTSALILEHSMHKWIEWPASVVGVDLGTLRFPATVNTHVSQDS